ncbi:MAG: hypothetical protein JO165_05050 [Candidatus Eremiobacteraeota bacterium]|nr:hypothetical protein [Candidatus Eremiobacteraeota bacterium]
MYPLIFALAAATASPPAGPPEGSYTYDSAIPGRGKGATSVNVRRSGGGIVLDEHATGASDTISGSGKATMTLDAALTPVSYHATYSFGGSPTDVTVNFNAAGATESAVAGNQTFSLGDVAQHFVVVDGVLLSGYIALPAQMRAWQNSTVMGVVPMFGRAFQLAPDTTLQTARPKTVPANDTVLAFTSPVAFFIWYDPATLVVDEIDVPSQGATITRRR